jgi:isopenicillin-N epimerase
MIGAMVTVPLPASIGSTREQATALRTALLVDDRIEAPIHEWHGRLWVRVSAQVYNDLSDIERLADAVLKRID